MMPRRKDFPDEICLVEHQQKFIPLEKLINVSINQTHSNEMSLKKNQKPVRCLINLEESEKTTEIIASHYDIERLIKDTAKYEIDNGPYCPSKETEAIIKLAAMTFDNIQDYSAVFIIRSVLKNYLKTKNINNKELTATTEVGLTSDTVPWPYFLMNIRENCSHVLTFKIN